MNPPNTAPKDKQFLADFGYPWLVVTHWNDANLEWTYANFQVGLLDGEWNDTYFETETEPEASLLGWMEMPTKPEKP